MLISDTSVKRPVFAMVLSMLLVTFGLMSYQRLPLREYPDINAPVVSIETTYRGSSADIVESRVTQVIEDQVSGIEGIKTIESTSEDGRSTITIEFQLSRDIDAAANDVRDRVGRILNDIPEEADPPEISKLDANTQPIMWLGLTSDTLDRLELTDYAQRNLVDRLSVVEGVARVRIGGEKRYAMRVWLDRRALAARGLTVSDLEQALRSENVELPAGRLESDERDITLRLERLYKSAEDFEDLVIARGSDGYLVKLGDVARVELGAQVRRTNLSSDGQEAIGLGISKQSKANTLAVTRGVRTEMESIQDSLPPEISISVKFDSSIFVEEAIFEVIKTFLIAIVLVIIVIYAFLGSFRAVLIPSVTIPISIIASFMGLLAFGFSVNILTLLALILAIGLVVDDAIVVLENIYRLIDEGKPPLVAAFNGARQVGFAVIATTVVLVAVFVPIAFMQGNTGRLFTEFAFALAGAVVFSSLVALTLAPMMCSKILSRKHTKNALSRGLDWILARVDTLYVKTLNFSRRHFWFPLLMMVAIIVLIGMLYPRIPKEFQPQEDRGVVFAFMKAPEGAGFDYTLGYMNRIEQSMLKLVESGEAHSVVTIVPQGFNALGDVNSGFGIALLKPWGERERGAQEIAGQLFMEFSGLPGVQAFPILPKGLGQQGFSQPVQFVIGGSDYDELARWRDLILEKASENPRLQGIDTDYQERKPQIRVNVDRERASDLGVPVETIGRTLETMLGSRRVTTFLDRGEEYDVILQSRDEDRRSPHDLSNIYVRSSRSARLIPLSNLVTLEEIAGPSALNRYNRVRAITINANLAEGYTLGEALEFLRDSAEEVLPREAQIDYKGESLEFRESSGSLNITFALALLIVFLVLAAQFESFINPFIIMLTVPMAIAGALAGLFFSGMTLNVYSQIGMVMLIGLASKNGILIVEFANQLRDEGLGFEDALMTASRQRLRPILMTGLSTAIGAIPLVMATGAGAESRAVLGVVIFSGAVFATFFTLFIVPVMYLLIARFASSPGAVTRELEDLQKTSR